MHVLKIDYSKNKKQQVKSILLGAIHIAIGLAALYFCRVEQAGIFFWCISGLYFISGILFLVEIILRRSKYIIIDDEGIEEKLSAHSGVRRIYWKDVKKVEINILQVFLHSKSGKDNIIHFSNLPYRDVKTIKLKIFSFCLQERIPCSIKSIKKEEPRKDKRYSS
ncbi:MAG: hypothetical protein FWF54_07070 [Candidatus Azobacteroides sp.]|nr:hypothetical protein [Candidatus Azobacteroides sp.]